VTVLEEILAWSQDRPAWQRDALRRLLQNGQLSDDDVGVLTNICKSSQGLAEQPEIVPLAEEHIPQSASGMAAVSLVSIFHHRGVNALAEGQTLNFGPGLTLVYGDNAAGKTGYTRILKSACRARGPEEILGNVVSEQMPLSPVVSVKYRVDGESDARDWTGGTNDSVISRVSVFDSHCAAVYLNEKTNVAFRPFGLDLFDRLVKACKAVRATLEKEQSDLASNLSAPVLSILPQGTEAARTVANINSLTNPETIRSLATLSHDEQSRLALLEKSLLDLQAADPAKLIRELNLRRNRLKKLAEHIDEVEAVLSTDSLTEIVDLRTEGRRKSEEAKRLREVTLIGVLPGTGSDTWKELWEAARRFSNEEAYPDRQFPAPVPGSCVLCQRALDTETDERFKRFEAFVSSVTEVELRQTREKFVRLRKNFTELKILDQTVDETIKEVSLDNEDVANLLASALAVGESRRRAILSALVENRDLGADCPQLIPVAQKASELVLQMDARIKLSNDPETKENHKSMMFEIEELRARKILAKHEKTVLNEIERRRKYAAYALCIDETKTQSITQKSTAVTKTAVSERLKTSFRDELLALDFRHVEVELKEVGGADGVLYHRLVLSRAPGVELPKVASEGEQRCLSVAAFFAELSTADSPSAIVFDDPVSSLDYKWREKIAERLVEEAKTRQVIVFTHDIVFLLQLRQKADEAAVEQLDQHVRRLGTGAGVCSEELPWVALPTKKKIGHLKNEWQAADKLFRQGNQDAYEKEAKYLYGLLREAWERGLEEILLGGIVERFRHNVETKQIACLADITPEDCQTVEAAMTKTSKWLPGHDQAAAARAPVPEPAELKSDIEELESWVSRVKNRR
jgi:energy-coupling factor transporter ATP-binding protein EcfA2